jgi:hypothetical protein
LARKTPAEKLDEPRSSVGAPAYATILLMTTVDSRGYVAAVVSCSRPGRTAKVQMKRANDIVGAENYVRPGHNGLATMRILHQMVLSRPAVSMKADVVLHRMRLLVRPETVLRWHRDLIAAWHARMSRPKRLGRPRTVRSIRLPLTSIFGRVPRAFE